MTIMRTSQRNLVTLARLALVTIISSGLATTTHFSAANTLLPLPESSMTAPALATLHTNTLTAKEPGPLDQAMNALSPNNALRYRAIFAAQKTGEWTKAEALTSTLSDKRLLGHVQADRYQRGHAKAGELKAWLKRYADLPEAETIYALAKKNNRKDLEQLPVPSSAETWSGGAEADEAAEFAAEVKTDGAPEGTGVSKLAHAINHALRHDDPTKARNLLIAAEAEGPLAGTVAADAEAAIAAGFFYMGEREQARSLASAAAGAQQPLGLWIQGLIAWEQDETPLASSSFVKLAGHPALNAGGRAAAHFWAYRALNRRGEGKEAHRQLELAADEPRSFYGLLSAQLLGRNPVAPSQAAETLSIWNAQQRAVMASHPAGWRALALIQVGETSLAEAELRRLDPQEHTGLQQAMMALANFVPMPALVLHLASLSGTHNDSGRAALLYPLPPWQPSNGFEIDRALLYALVRHESQFDPSAVSARGARGLMQIMPATANGMDARREGLASAKLFDPEYNLALGQKYVRHLTSQPQIGNNLLLLLAAYNGGPNKVTRWIETSEARQGKKTIDPLLFVESIPQRETRQYITRVLPYYWAYRARLDEPLTSLHQLAEGKWPRLAPASEKDIRQAEALQTAKAVKLAGNQNPAAAH